MGNTGKPRLPWRLRPVTEGMRVTRLEIFFDLVFVYALFNVSRATYADLNPDGLLRGLLVLALLWWCWTSYVWVGNSVRAGEGAMPLVLFTVMAAVFVVALTLPEAFADIPGGLSGPMVFAGCYLVIRAMSLVIFWHVNRDQPGLLRRTSRLALPILVATTILVLAALLPPRLSGVVHPFAVQATLWLLVVAVEYTAGVLLARTGWTITSAAHWTERYELVVIIALGELIVSVGSGTNPLTRPITWPIAGAAILAIIVTATLWWAYFDIIALAAQQVLNHAHSTARTALARDAYVYLHLPMIIGLLTLALGAEKALQQVGENRFPLSEPLRSPGVYLLFGGVILFLLAHLGFQLRILGTLTWIRLGTIVALAALTPVAAAVPTLAALAILTAVCVTLVCAELVILATSRRVVREAVLEEHLAHETRETQWRKRHR
ncbi:low temperature requirement protein A [Plantactinospora mayteni]|uniref:Low temperature requirement protein A n=1 Tax=Plantactinospora mayteni TaxID=566021 RepID=A0ABQ4F271_9ACTN|nr:low temperature requirement protein A [Plantactinospora mayteni]GIH00996.1 low temperature requirement protein A [Plantactinospora mayteni]